MSAKYPLCSYDRKCVNGIEVPYPGEDATKTSYCQCPLGEIMYYESTGAAHDVAVSVAAITYATEIRQYDFEGHDNAFEDFNNKFINNGYSNDGSEYTTWVAENQPAVQWALDFSDLRQYL